MTALNREKLLPGKNGWAEWKGYSIISAFFSFKRCKSTIIFSCINWKERITFAVYWKQTSICICFSSRDSYNKCLFLLKVSLINRLILLRSTAFLNKDLGTLIKSWRGYPQWIGYFRTMTLNGKEFHFSPSSNSFLIRTLLFNRSSFVKVWFMKWI